MSRLISAAGSLRRMKEPIARFSHTVIRPKTRRASGTSEMPRRTISPVDSPSRRFPSNSTVPACGRTMPRIVFIVVDFPEALPPSRQTISPAWTSSVTPLRAGMGPEKVSTALSLSMRGAASEICLEHGRVAAYRLESPLGYLDAVVQSDDAIADAADELTVV